MPSEYDENSIFSAASFLEIKFDDLKMELPDHVFDYLGCLYRGEGNENLVLYIPKIKFVVRFLKHHENDDIDPSYEKEKLKIFFLYYSTLLEPFFSIRYITPPIIAEISEAYLKYLDEKLFSRRPGHRKDKRILFGGVEIHPDYAFLSQCSHVCFKNRSFLNQVVDSDSLKKAVSPDYLNFRNYVYSLFTSPNFVNNLNQVEKNSGRTTFGVEIKPKQAWIAEPYRKFNVCTFCMNQYFKLHEHEIKNKSEYCPLDLFSGIESRMKNALKGLLRTPQNNLKIFKNGEVVFGENITCNFENVLADWFFELHGYKDVDWYQDHFCKLLIAILKNDFKSIQNLISFKTEPYVGSNKNKICSNEKVELINRAFQNSNLECDHNSTILPKNCILDRIMEMQKLDTVGLESVLEFYETHAMNNLDQFSHIDDLISRIKFQSGDIEYPILNVVEAYTLSTAAKDLSVMIAIQNIPSDSHSTSEYTVDVDGVMYEFNVSVVDVGPKPLSCVKKHWKRDKKIITSCLNHFYPDLKN